MPIRIVAANKNPDKPCCDSCKAGNPCQKGKVLLSSNMKQSSANLGFSDAEKVHFRNLNWRQYRGADGSISVPQMTLIDGGVFGNIPLSEDARSSHGRELYATIDYDQEVLYIPASRKMADCFANMTITDNRGCWEWWSAPINIWNLNRQSPMTMEILANVNVKKGRAQNWSQELQTQVNIDADNKRKRAEAADIQAKENAKAEKEQAKQWQGVSQVSQNQTGILGIRERLMNKGKTVATITQDPNWKPDKWLGLSVYVKGAQLQENTAKAQLAPKLYKPETTVELVTVDGKRIPLELFTTDFGVPIWGIEGEEGLLAVVFKNMGGRYRPGPSEGPDGRGGGYHLSTRLAFIENDETITNFMIRVQE